MRGPAGAEAHPPDPGNRWPEREGDLGARARGGVRWSRSAEGYAWSRSGGTRCRTPDEEKPPGGQIWYSSWPSALSPLGFGSGRARGRPLCGCRTRSEATLPRTGERTGERTERRPSGRRARPRKGRRGWAGERQRARTHPRRPARAAAKPWRWVRRAGERSRDAPRAGWEPAETPREVPQAGCHGARGRRCRGRDGAGGVRAALARREVADCAVGSG